MTNASGRFTFLAVSPGPYVLKTALFILATQTSPDVMLSATQALTVGDSDITGLAVTVKSGVRVSGRVEFKGAADPAPPRVAVVLRPIAAESWTAARGQVRADRTFTTEADSPGRYELYAASAGAWRVVSVSRGGRVLPDFTIDLGADDIADVLVSLSDKPARISGAVAEVKALDLETDVIVFPADTSLWREGVFQSRRVQLVRATSAGGSCSPYWRQATTTSPL